MKNKQGLIGIFEGMTKNQKIKWVLQKHKFILLNEDIFGHRTPPDCQCDWDMIIAKPNTSPLKLQVKTTGNKVASGQYAVGLKDGHYTKLSSVKVLEIMIYCLH